MTADVGRPQPPDGGAAPPGAPGPYAPPTPHAPPTPPGTTPLPRTAPTATLPRRPLLAGLRERLLGPVRWGARVRRAVRRHGHRLRDALYLMFGALITLTVVGEPWEGRGTPTTLLVATATAVGTVALLWRRRFPVGVVLFSLASLPATQGYALVTVALFALAVRRRDRVLALTTTLAWPASVLTELEFGNPGIVDPGTQDLATSVVTSALTLGFAVAAGAYIGARRDLVDSLRARAEEAETALALRSDQARLAERTRIAQEMHDVLAHRISLVTLHAGGLEVRPDAGPEEVEKAAALIRGTARQALEDLRGVLGVLRADASAHGVELTPQPRLEDLPRLVASSTAAGVPVTLMDELPAGAVVPEVMGRTVYRVVQEALTNVHKHARDARTWVTLAGAPRRELRVTVTNVRPVSADTLLPGSGMGLVGLRERVQLAGGVLEAGPTPTGGWQLEARFRWPA